MAVARATVSWFESHPLRSESLLDKRLRGFARLHCTLPCTSKETGEPRGRVCASTALADSVRQRQFTEQREHIITFLEKVTASVAEPIKSQVTQTGCLAEHCVPRAAILRRLFYPCCCVAPCSVYGRGFFFSGLIAGCGEAMESPHDKISAVRAAYGSLPYARLELGTR